MKKALLDILACPICHGEIRLTERHSDGEIVEGKLVCVGCGKKFPIIGGIPRLMVDFQGASTAERFGYEWKHFPEISPVYEMQFLDWIKPITQSFFREKAILDAGCGKGRHLRIASRFGAKMVVGIDASEAVCVAYANTKDFPNVHVIQGDIYHPPLRRSFDYIYSIGVLHHLSHPDQGFGRLLSLLKPSGTISVWVYGKEGNAWIIYLVNPWRKFITSKMPLPVLEAFCYPVALFLHLLCRFVYRPFNLHLRPLRRFLFYNDYLFYISNFSLRETHSIVFDHLLAPVAFYLPKDDVAKWFQSSGLVDVHIEWHNRNSWKANGRLVQGVVKS